MKLKEEFGNELFKTSKYGVVKELGDKESNLSESTKNYTVNIKTGTLDEAHNSFMSPESHSKTKPTNQAPFKSIDPHFVQ